MIYLDNAATTFPKPQGVPREVLRCISEYCGNPGRSGHALSLAAAKKVFECREVLCDLFGVSDPSRVIFTQNTTHSLNLIIKGILSEGDHVIISDMEHNSVLRPIEKLFADGIAEYSVFGTFPDKTGGRDELVLRSIESLIKKNTRLLVCSHASNICSVSLPIRKIGDLCRARGILFAVDAAQSAGILPINVEKMNISALAIPSHKALYGPQGCGALILGKDVELRTLIDGGSGTNSLEPFMPPEPPERYEAGTLPTPAIAGLCEGVKFVRTLGLDWIKNHENELFRDARAKLMNIQGIEIYAPRHVGSTLLFNKKGITPEELASQLDDSGICVRAGYHCSPLGHKTLGTIDTGAVRISFGIYNTKKDVDLFAKAVSKI